jgi:hypothetical protein
MRTGFKKSFINCVDEFIFTKEMQGKEDILPGLHIDNTGNSFDVYLNGVRYKHVRLLEALAN